MLSNKNILRLKDFWHNSVFLNKLRYFTNYIKIKISVPRKKHLRLHLGCGGIHLNGYINIDWRKAPGVDLVMDIKKLPYPSESVEQIETYHTIEHIPYPDILNTFKEWKRLLTKSGKLIIECPDFDAIVKKYINGDEKQLNHIFGLQRFHGDTHYYGYNVKRLKRLLKQASFTNIRSQKASDYHTNEIPSLRIECKKQ